MILSLWESSIIYGCFLNIYLFIAVHLVFLRCAVVPSLVQLQLLD